MKYLKYLRVVLLLVATIIIVATVVTGNPEGKLKPEAADYPYLSAALWLAYAVVAFTVFLAVVMPLVGIAQNPKGAVKSLLGLLLMGVIVGIAYAMSSGDPITLSNGTLFDKVGALKFTDTALTTVAIAFGGVVLSIVTTEFYRIFK